MEFNGPEGQEDMPYLLTAGPLTTARAVKLAMLADWGSADEEFKGMVAEIRRGLKRLAGCDDSYDCVLLQGPASFAVEAALGSFTPARRRKTLVLANGVAGERAAKIMERLGRPFERVSKADTSALQASHFTGHLEADPSLTHVWLVHCETAAGLMNPLADLAREVKARGRLLMVDATASLGVLEINMARDGIDVLVSTSSNSIGGVPGFSFILARRELLQGATGNSPSIAFDLHEHWKAMEAGAEFCFTPPSHALAAFHQALATFTQDGGALARIKLYQRNAEVVLKGLSELGLVPLLSGAEASPIIQCFLTPRDPNFKFDVLQQRLRKRGFVIAKGLLAQRDSFRIGTVGQVNEDVMQRLVEAMRDVLAEMKVTDMMPRDL